MSALTGYTRWRANPEGTLEADILGAPITIIANPAIGTILINADAVLSPDEARLIGVRLIDAAVLADGDRVIRGTPDGAR